jgi:ribose-phosphate pyrophosphokinase
MAHKKHSIQVAKKGSLVLVSGRGYEKLANDIADILEISLLPAHNYDFANGEIYVQFAESVRDKDVFVVQSHAAPINKNLMEHLIMIDALKRASAHRITAVAPSLAYARQDKKHRSREPITARLVSDFFHTAGADRIMTVDLHAPQIQGFFPGPVDHIEAGPLFIKYFKQHYNLDNFTIVAPDAGRAKTAEKWAASLGGQPMAFIHKTRDVTKPNEVHTGRVIGEVKGRDCIIADDMIDTAGTIVGAVKALRDAGAESIMLAATHAILSDPAVELLKAENLREVVVTDTLPIAEEKRFPELTVLSIAPLLADSIRAIFEGESLGTLIEAEQKSAEIVVI